MKIIRPLGSLDKTMSKENIAEFAEQNVNEIVSADKYDLLRVYAEIKRYNFYLNSIISQLKPYALDTALDKENEKMNYDIARISVIKRTTYDFSEDKIWHELNENVKNHKSRLYQHQEMLKAIDGKIKNIVDEDTGEIIEVTPPKKTEHKSIMVRLI